MKRKFPALRLIVPIVAVLAVAGLPGYFSKFLTAKEKAPAVGPDDATFRLFQLLDNSYEGRLPDFYVLADIYKEAKTGDEFQHVLRASYGKNRAFGKLNLHVRSLAKMDPEQLKAYTPKQIYEFGAEDTEKFVKSEVGPLGRTGDLYLRAVGDHPLASAPITDEARKAYESYVTQYLLPALQKK